jgi:hypothetical protein
MAKQTGTPELNSEDIAALLEALRRSDQPMTTQDLVAALRAAANR